MNLRRRIILSFGIPLVVFWSAGKVLAGDSFPVIPQLAEPPVIDGQIDEPVWNQALIVQLHYADADTPGEPDNPTIAYAFTTQENGEEYIYFAFKCIENHPNGPFIANPNHKSDNQVPLEVSDFVRVRASFGRWGRYAFYLFESNTANTGYASGYYVFDSWRAPTQTVIDPPAPVYEPLPSFKSQSKIFDGYWCAEIKVALRELIFYPGGGIPKYMELEFFRERVGDDRTKMLRNIRDNSDPDALILFDEYPHYWRYFYNYIQSWTRMSNPHRFCAEIYKPAENKVYNDWRLAVTNPLWFKLVILETGTVENKLVSREDTFPYEFFHCCSYSDYDYTQEERNRLRIEWWEDTIPLRPRWKGDPPLIQTTPLEYKQTDFSQQPQVRTTDEGALISFAVNDYIDVAVAILDSQGKIIRHLASGVLGANPPAPLKPDSLAQEILWDWKDDNEKVVSCDNYKVKVYLGLTPKFGLFFPKDPDVPEYVQEYKTGITQSGVAIDVNLGSSEPGISPSHRTFGSDHTIYVDRETEEVYIGGYFIYDGITGSFLRHAKLCEKLPLQYREFRYPELIVGPDNYWWLTGWCDLRRYDKSGNKIPWSLLQSYIIPQINRGHNNPHRGHCFGGPDNDCYIVHHYGPHGNSAGVITQIGLDAEIKQWGVVEIPTPIQGVKVDRQGYIYTSCALYPKGQILIPSDFAPVITDEINNYYKEFYGSVIKFSPKGGKIITGESNYLCCISGSGYVKTILLGAEWIHPWISPLLSRGDVVRCNCESSRFELDPFERLWIPDAVRSRVEITDKNANTIKIIGQYGDLGSNSEENIYFGFPMAISVSDKGCYVGDFFYRQGVKLDLTYKQEADADIDYITDFTIITSSSLPMITQGENTAVTLDIINAVSSNLQWQVINGVLPPGISIDSNTGVISGVPAQAGSYTFTLRVVDSALQECVKTFTLIVSVPQGLTLATDSLYNAVLSMEYKFQLTAEGGIPPYKWLLKSGLLPNGLSFNAETGYIYGTAKNIETRSFEIELSDSSIPVPNIVSKQYSLTVKQGGSGDYIPPAAITDFAIIQNGSTMVKFSWTSTGDDDKQGYSSAYILRYSTTGLSDISPPSEKDAWWSNAVDASGLPRPKVSGSIEQSTVFNLTPNTTYYFVIKAVDDDNNFSQISNVCITTTFPLPQEYAANIRADCSGESGPCYTSLKDWEVDYGGIDYGTNAKGDLVAVNKIAVAKCYNDWLDGMEADVELKGWNTDADHYIKIYAPSGQRHNSIDYNSGFWIKETHGWSLAVSIAVPYTRIEAIGFNPKNEGSSGIVIGNGITDVRIDSCIFKNNNRTYKSVGIYTGCGTNNFIISNCVFQGLDTGVYAGGYTMNGRILDSIASGCKTGFSQSKEGDKTTISNSIAYKNLVSNWSTVENWHINSSNNASNESAGELIPGQNSVTDAGDFDFVNYAGSNFHLSETSKLRGKGADFSTVFTKDIDGEMRPAGKAWDIGIDQIEGGSYLIGDVNGDGQVNVLDVQALVNHILGGVIYDNADVNGDSIVNVLDVQAVVNAVLGGEA